MGRILFFVLLGVALYVGFRIWRSGRRHGESPVARPGEASEPMIRCAHCGLNIPRSEAIAAGDRYFCSSSHQRLHDQRQ